MVTATTTAQYNQMAKWKIRNAQESSTEEMDDGNSIGMAGDGGIKKQQSHGVRCQQQ